MTHSPRHRLLPPAVRRAVYYRQIHARWPPPLRPRTFTEKLNWRISFDRRPLLAPTCDKLAMKEIARREAPGLLRIPGTCWAGTDLAGLAGADLPGHWVLKSNHSCRRVLVGAGTPDVPLLARRTSGWLEERYERSSGEWAYRRARRCLLVEEHIGEPGQVPADVKILTVGGAPQLVEVHTRRGPGHRVRLYDPHGEPLPWTLGYPAGPDAPPERLEDLVKAATAVAAGFDMLRVDCYEAAGELWFGELTPYPAAGLGRMEPELDRALGDAWPLPAAGPPGVALPLPVR